MWVDSSTAWYCPTPPCMQWGEKEGIRLVTQAFHQDLPSCSPLILPSMHEYIRYSPPPLS